MIATLGGLLLFLSAFALIIGLSLDAIPANWPLEPQRREDHPEAFRRYVYGWSGAAILGVVLVIAGLLFS